MITTKMASPTHSDAAVFKEHILCPCTCFTLSTLNTSLNNAYCSAKTKVA
jgi:3-polyprenyl-4-hydroxybenzoate decarboxylase